VLQPRVLDVNALVAGIHRMLTRLIGEDVALVTRPGDGLWAVRADPGQLEQIVVNLVVNARDAMPHGGTVTIETGNVMLDESYTRRHPALDPGPYVLLAVSDTGTGMDAAIQARLFEPFFSTKGSRGTGLGLSTVLGIVQQSGGHVAVYSEPGMGSTFKVYLPREAAVPERPTATPPPRRAAPVGAETILVAEDSEGVRHLVRDVLARAGYRVLEARDGEEALRVAREHAGPIHLLLTDVVMPGAGGRAAAEGLTAARPETRVVYMSGYTEDAILTKSVLEAGADFLEKPFTPRDLEQKVREVLGRR
jgi:CheY-like chemotaxis protein